MTQTPDPKLTKPEKSVGVTINGPKNVVSLLKKLDVDADLLAKVEAKGWKPSLNGLGLRFAKDGVKAAYGVSIAAKNILEIYAGEFSPTKTLILRHQIENVLISIIDNDEFNKGAVTQGVVTGKVTHSTYPGAKSDIKAMTYDTEAGKWKVSEHLNIAEFTDGAATLSVKLNTKGDTVPMYDIVPMHAPAASAPPVPVPPPPPKVFSTLALLKKPPASTQNAPPQGVWPTFDLTKLNTAPPVRLRDATHMYQPVKGTNEGSRYFMVAANHKVKVAARLFGDGLSIRVEGPGWETVVSNLKDLGFEKIVPDKGYASVHLKVEDGNLAAKTLGAIIMGLQVSFETPLPNVTVIAHHGN